MTVNDAKEISENNTAIADKATSLMLVIIGIGVLVAVGLGLFILRIIKRPVNKLVGIANQLALGDIDVTVEVESDK
jgi:methyl-accepting chemotaxis protein